MKPARGLAIVALVVTLCVVMSVASAERPAVGIVRGTFERFTNSLTDRCTLSLSFAGRMPAGNSTYTVFLGTMDAVWQCTAPEYTLYMHATSVQGFFDWVCTGATKPGAFRCRTVGLPGRFRMVLAFVTVTSEPHCCGFSNEVVGAYSVKK